jgi:Leucine-rich repeat (LRR) protein
LISATFKRIIGNNDNIQGQGIHTATQSVMPEKKTRSLNLLDRISECDHYSVDISHLELEEWPAELLIVAQVKGISAYKNKISHVPSLAAFRGLEELDISRNFIVSLKSVDFSALIKLKRLDISRNLLEQLPEDVTQLPLLEVLIAHRNKLSSFPIEMGSLKALKILDVSYNNLTTLGSTFELNLNLEDLNTANNELLSTDNMGPRTRRMCDKRTLLASKVERRKLITRALAVSKNVIVREEQVIFDEYYKK